MEAIPKEVIEMAMDFYSYLKQNERVELFTDFVREQPFLIRAFQKNIAPIIDRTVANKCVLIFSIIYKCYKYYDVKLPVIQQQVVKDTHKHYEKDLTKPGKIHQSIFDSQHEMKNITNQHNIMDYIILQLSGTEDEPIEYIHINDLRIANVEINVLLLILNNEMKKHSGAEIN